MSPGAGAPTLAGAGAPTLGCGKSAHTGRFARYASRMPSQHIENRKERTPVLRKAVAGVVLIAVAALVITTIVHFVLAILWVVVGIVAVGAVLWALNALL